MPQIIIGRDELLKGLEETRLVALRENGRIAREHKKKCDAALATFRAKLREALKWDYKAATKARYGDLSINSPACPQLATTDI